LQARIEVLENALKTAQEERDELEIRQIYDNNKELAVEIERLQGLCLNHATEKHALKAQLDKANETIDRLESEKNKLTKELNKSKKRNTELENELDRMISQASLPEQPDAQREPELNSSASTSANVQPTQEGNSPTNSEPPASAPSITRTATTKSGSSSRQSTKRRQRQGFEDLLGRGFKVTLYEDKKKK